MRFPTMLRWIAAGTLALSVTACQPVRPQAEQATAPATPATVEEPALAATDVAGRYTGSLSVAGLTLEIVVNLEAEETGYAGTIDIPQQGATGVPLHDIRVDPPSIHFEMLAGPQLAVFDGEINNGVITGAFSQSGYDGEFTLAAAGAGEAEATTPGKGVTYTDPAGRFSLPVPTNWTAIEHAGYVLVTDPEESIKVYALALEGTDIEQALAEGWKLVDPTFDLGIEDTVEPPSQESVEQTLVHVYDTGTVNRIAQGIGQLKDGVVYVILVDAELAGLQRRNAQLTIIGSGFKILAIEKTDLSGAQPLPVTATVIEALEEFITTYMEKFGIPGAAVGIVEGDQLVYAKGFGMADPAAGVPMAPDTHVMIGSTGKSLTTMLMGTLVDDGLMSWDTPARELYPDFKVKDPGLSATITMRNLVCACTGVPRRDLELLFNASTLSAVDIVASLADFEFFTDFGEAFQYSNQMVATAGYIAGVAAGLAPGDLEEGYAEALQARVLDPIGMEHTTLSFAEVRERNRFATPHIQTLFNTYEPAGIVLEEMLIPVAPAGVHWSTLEDMARYLITEINEGVAPGGVRVISAENLAETWKPQIAVSADAAYGLGWLVSDYKGIRVISHGGNTVGFTSGFVFLPDVDLGIVVLTNARASNLFNEGVAGRLLELVFNQEPETARSLEFYLEQVEEQLVDLRAQILDHVDSAAIESHLGRFHNPALGDIVLDVAGDSFLLDAGEFRTELRPKIDDQGELEGYIQMDPPLQGAIYKLEVDGAGKPVVVLGEGAVQYTFTQSE